MQGLFTQNVSKHHQWTAENKLQKVA